MFQISYRKINRLAAAVAAVMIFGSLPAAEKSSRTHWDFSTRADENGKSRDWPEKRCKIQPEGIGLIRGTFCYNPSVIPLFGKRNAVVKFRYRGKNTQCGLFFYGKKNALCGRDLVYLPNSPELREFTGEFPIPAVSDRKSVIGIRLVFLTSGEGTVSDVSLTLLP